MAGSAGYKAISASTGAGAVAELGNIMHLYKILFKSSIYFLFECEEVR